MNKYEKLLLVQTKLKAPKSQYNSFGKYSYRNCEDILEALKPLLEEIKAVVVVSDSIEVIGERYYLKAVASFYDIENDSSIEVQAFAREEESKKGMDGSQVTGASSSYARKYALNGLFAIDDTKDSDSANNRESKPTTKESLSVGKETTPTNIDAITEGQAKRIFAIAKGNQDLVKRVLGKYGFTSSKAVTKETYKTICEEIEFEVNQLG